MEVNNGVFIILALSSLLFSFSADAICVPRNSSEFLIPAKSPIANHVSINISPSASPPESSSSSPSSSSPPSSTPSFSSTSDLISSGGLRLPSTEFPGGLELSSSSEVVKICDVTSNPSLCAESISPYLHGSVDPVTALKTEIQASIKEIENAVAKMTELRKDPSTSTTTIDCFDVCQESFSTAIDDLKAAVESINTHDVSRMESVLAGTMTDITTCDDAFAESGEDSPLDDLTTKMSKYASNCLAISKLLM